MQAIDPMYPIAAKVSFKLKFNIPPKECLLRVYPETGTELLTEHYIQIYNCLDRDKTFKDFKTFIHQEIVNLSSLKDLDFITIENAIKQVRKNAFQFQDLLNARNNEELDRIWNFILRK